MAIDSSNQFALHHSRKKQIDRSTLYIDSFLELINPKTDYAKASCPTCSFQPKKPLFIKKKGEYAYCPHCDHIFLLNPLSLEKLIEFYVNYPTSSLEWHRNESEFYRRIYQLGITLFDSHRHGSRLLDIGCSSGYFLSIAAQHGLDVFGIEPNAREAHYAVNNGIKVIGSTLESLPDDLDYFDVITLWDVLEHICQPVNYLSALRPFLGKNGLIFVQVPTSDSLAARIMREDCNMFDGIEHQTLFSSSSLDSAFEQAGFNLVDKKSVISEMHAITNYLSYQTDPYLDAPLIPFKSGFFSENMLENFGLGYKIQAVYRLAS